MDTNIRLQKCFAKLGYFGTIPISLQSNPSTSLIWEQFISNVEPQNEVDVCRKNIIIDRLQRTSGVKNLVEYPIREIQVYNELKVSKENIARIGKRIQEKQNRESFVIKSNKSNYLYISSLKEYIEEKTIKLHILKLKSSNLENEIKKIDEQINVRGLALISDEDSLPAETVSNVLQNLLDKIERLAQYHEIPRINQNRYAMSSRHNVSSTQPPPKKCFSTIKKNKTNFARIQRFGSCANVNAVKSLFVEGFKENDVNAENVKGGGKEDDDLKLLDQSAGILPDSCFDFRADDEFLMSFRSAEDVLAGGEYDDASKNESVFDNSSNYQSIFQARLKRDYFETAQTDEFVKQNVDELYRGASVRVIWALLLDLREHLLQNIRFGLENVKTIIRFKNNETTKEDIAKLNFIYIKNNLLTLKSKKKVKQLMEAIRQRKSYIENQLGDVGEGRLRGLELVLESIKLEAAIQFMHKEMNNRKTDSAATLNSLNANISKAKEEVFMKIKEIEGYIESKEDLMQRLKICQEDAAMCVRRLSKFIFQPIWVEGLTENVHSREIAVFEEFPLYYNKNFCFTDKNSFYRDSVKTVILDQDTPNDTLYMINSLVVHPQYPPERTLIEALKKKHKLQIMSSMKFPKIEIESKNHSLQEFQKQEEYVERMCEMLMSNIRSMKTHQVLNSTSRMKSNMDLWLNMPFKRFISKKRTVEGKTYKEYEEKFDYLRSNK